MMRPRNNEHATTLRADEHRDARSPDEAGENVASEFVGAAKVMRRRRLEAIGKIDVAGSCGAIQGAKIAQITNDDDQHALRRPRMDCGGRRGQCRSIASFPWSIASWWP